MIFMQKFKMKKIQILKKNDPVNNNYLRMLENKIRIKACKA